MDFWAIIGIVSSLLGIYSFLKNGTSILKKSQQLYRTIKFPFLKNLVNVYFYVYGSSMQSLYKKNLI